jgi:hypothetical protein
MTITKLVPPSFEELVRRGQEADRLAKQHRGNGFRWALGSIIFLFLAIGLQLYIYMIRP